jgi:hypothetical protein
MGAIGAGVPNRIRSCGEFCSDPPCPEGVSSPRCRAGERPRSGCDGAPWKEDGGVAFAAPIGPPAAPCPGGRSPGLPRPLPRSGEGERFSRGPVAGGVTPGCPRPAGLPRSAGEGEACPALSSGFAIAPGRVRSRAFSFPRPDGEGEVPNEGAVVAPGITRPRFPRGPGDVSAPPVAFAGLVPAPGTGLPSARAAARVGGGMFFEF